MRPGAIGVAVVAIALVAGGLFFGLGGPSSDGGPAGSIPRATLPQSTVAPPAPAVVGTGPPATPTSPGASTATSPETTVTFPEGTETLPVPNVLGVSQATAESRLADFEVEVTVVAATEAELFDVISDQNPAGGGRLPAGGTVSITLSYQPTPVTIPADPLPVGEFTAVDYADMEVGDCGNGAVVEEILVYERIDCDEFHDVQLIDRFDVEGGPDEFDQLELDELVRDQCEQPFEDFVGAETGDSELLLRSIRPNDTRYGTEGERTSLCVAIPQGTARIQGSAEGSLW